MFWFLNLTKKQYKYFASFFRTLAEAIIIGDSAAFFFPETLQLKHAITPERYMIFLSIGLICLFLGAILEKKG